MTLFEYLPVTSIYLHGEADVAFAMEMDVPVLADLDWGHSGMCVLRSWEAGFVDCRMLVCYIATLLSPAEWFAIVHLHVPALCII